jgi:hypothetical protein
MIQQRVNTLTLANMSLEEGKTTLVCMFLHVSYVNSADSEAHQVINISLYVRYDA